MLQELPTELLSEIFSYLASSSQELRNISLQCRCFSLAVRPILLRAIAVSAYGGRNSRKLDLLNRSICENPQLFDMVHSLSLSWSESNIKLHQNMESLLSRLTALRSLKVQSNSEYPPFNHGFLNTNEMSQLAEVTLSDTNLTMDDLARYIFLERIHHLIVLWLRNPTPPIFDLLGWPEAEWLLPTLPENKIAGCSPVVLLDLGPAFHLPEPVLKEILSWPKALKHLRCTIPGKDYPNRFGVSKRLSTALSPASISRALSPVKHSLTSLELIDNGCEWLGHDATRIDLSDFRSLTKITVPSTCFFKNYTFGVKRGGMYTSLPPSLVELRIMYDLSDCIRPDEDERAPIRNASESLGFSANLELLNLGSPKDLIWLMELAQWKKDCSPNLKRVSLMERCGMLRSGIYPTNWNLPSAIAEAYHDAGIEFRAVMRAINPAPTFN